ncbi:MAG: ArsR family transcriptional regulator [bacterium]|nr:ArsR family transcriptional regulator [bacterium]
MITRFQRITIVRIRSPEKALNPEIQWLSESLGLFSERDKDKSCFRLFLAILQSKKSLSSDELAYKLDLSRATVIHHLSKLIASGLVVIEDDKYVLRAKNLEQTLKKMKQDVLSAYEEMEEKAKEIDKKLHF